jgi:hypothetical protein
MIGFNVQQEGLYQNFTVGVKWAIRFSTLGKLGIFQVAGASGVGGVCFK